MHITDITDGTTSYGSDTVCRYVRNPGRIASHRGIFPCGQVWGNGLNKYAPETYTVSHYAIFEDNYEDSKA